MRDYEIYTLDNGIRVVHKEVSSTKIVHCGFILNIGSRDEKNDQQGLAHFWEHMAFKGTTKRKAFHIINRLESVGGELNAYTTKEKICFYASILDNYFEKALELLTDITFDSIFPEKQIEKERGVILEEMAMYHDAPEDAIQDEFDNLVFKDHPLGNNILGTAESVRSFQKQDFKQFISENINTGQLIFSVVGNINRKKIKRCIEKYLATLPVRQAKLNRTPFGNYKAGHLTNTRELTQSQCAIGRPAYPLKDEKRLPFFMLTNILGGPGLNSRLNMALREKYGFVYSIEANYSAYSDTGLFSIFFGTDPQQLDRSIKIVLKELQKLKEKPLGSLQLHQAKEQLMGQLAMSEENNASLMLMMGRSLLDLNEIPSLESIFEKIKETRSGDLQDIAAEMFDEKQLSYLTYIPK
ncbi:pitrilysin family protein [Fulvivirgaceae bacterium BMA12]|uniref:Pitrilysin family protein n=1 Tax=Agaribacillus aureus TaxID=3051825 RepID=A0ABT8LE67_9BACT|nr:pitrilysin family protein [Fulvivirgaceae bacterium BMA12]